MDLLGTVLEEFDLKVLGVARLNLRCSPSSQIFDEDKGNVDKEMWRYHCAVICL